MIKKLLDLILTSFSESLKEHPSFTAFVVVLSAGILAYSVTVFADKADLEAHIVQANAKFVALDGQIRELGYGIAKRGLETEIFSLETTIERGNAVPSEKLRLKKLRSELGEVHRLNNLANTKGSK